MNFDIFDENYYLSKHPWLKPAIEKGIIASGRDHFERYGRTEGRTQVSRYFDESYYLANNPEIAPFVRSSQQPNAPFASGLDHFIQFGYEEGRTRVSPEFDEVFYLRNNSELLPFIQRGDAGFKNGYQHFIKFGSKEDRFGTSFFEPDYRRKNPDVVPFIESGEFKTGRDHYFQYGQYEENRSATFVGSRFNDTLTGAGVGDVELIGIEVGVSYTNGVPYGTYQSYGKDEFDTLIGSPGRDKFMFSYLTGFRGGYLSAAMFYTGPGYATIENFTQGQDSLELVGPLDDLLFTPINDNRDLAIVSIAIDYDPIAVIKGGGSLKLNPLSSVSPSERSIFLVG